MVLDSIKATAWTKKASKPRAQPDSPPGRSREGSSGDPAVQQSGPSYLAGPSMQQTRIGELENLRVGKPYWYLHQGNCEHIWTVDEVRSVARDRLSEVSCTDCLLLSEQTHSS